MVEAAAIRCARARGSCAPRGRRRQRGGDEVELAAAATAGPGAAAPPEGATDDDDGAAAAPLTSRATTGVAPLLSMSPPAGGAGAADMTQTHAPTVVHPSGAPFRAAAALPLAAAALAVDDAPPDAGSCGAASAAAHRPSQSGRTAPSVLSTHSFLPVRQQVLHAAIAGDATAGGAAAAASAAAAAAGAAVAGAAGAKRRGGIDTPTISSLAKVVTRVAAAAPASRGGGAATAPPRMHPSHMSSVAAGIGVSGAARANGTSVAFAASIRPQNPLWQTCQAHLQVPVPSPRLFNAVEVDAPSDGDCAPQSFVASLLASACAALDVVAAGGSGVMTAEAQLPVLAFAVSVVTLGAAAPAVAPSQSQSVARATVATFVNSARLAPLPVGAVTGARVSLHVLFPTAAQQLRAWAALHHWQSLIDGASAKQQLQLEYGLRLQLLADADVTDASAFYAASVEERTSQL